MDLIPMTHIVKIVRAGEGLDEWGYPVESATVEEVKGRVSFNTANRSISIAGGQEIVFNAEVWLPIMDVGYTDKIKINNYVEELEKSPIEIQVKHNFSGKPVMLKVVI